MEQHIEFVLFLIVQAEMIKGAILFKIDLWVLHLHVPIVEKQDFVVADESGVGGMEYILHRLIPFLLPEAIANFYACLFSAEHVQQGACCLG